MTLWRCLLQATMPYDEHRSGDHAPATDHYEELNVFGTHTGRVEFVREGEPLPAAPHGFTWRRQVGRPQRPDLGL
jgi:hypothetical protein